MEPFRSKITKFNQVDNKIDRRSFTGHYFVDPTTKRPRNPTGRTGSECIDLWNDRIHHAEDFSDWPWSSLSLGSQSCRWSSRNAVGRFHRRSAFCILSLSWKRDGAGAIVYRRRDAQTPSKPVLEFVAIQRRDTKQWALPGVSDECISWIDVHANVVREWSIPERISPKQWDESLKRKLDVNRSMKGPSHGCSPMDTSCTNRTLMIHATRTTLGWRQSQCRFKECIIDHAFTLVWSIL